MNGYEERVKRTKWMMESRFGMFIHWGVYAVPARGEWVQSHERLSSEQYKTYFDEFNPDQYDPRRWARLARKAGMKYAVLTAKHHDGFALFDSRFTDFKAPNTPAARDLVREYVEAFRAEGLKVGLYYSLIDWHHPDFPHYGDNFHPMRENEAFKEHTYNMKRYNKYVHDQVEELMTNYGTIDIIWFDFSYHQKQLGFAMSGDTWEADRLVGMIRQHQPDIIIDNRLECHDLKHGADMLTATDMPVYRGDFASPEHIIPPMGMRDSRGVSIPWEACITMNNSWGFHRGDADFKTPQTIIRSLVECVSKSGNMLLNVGPDARGNIPPRSVEILTEIGSWMDRNQSSIYGCGYADLEKPEWGRFTRKGNKLYAHIYERGIGALNVRGLAGKVQKVRMCATGHEVDYTTPWYAGAFTDDLFLEIGGAVLPDEYDTVVEISLKE